MKRAQQGTVDYKANLQRVGAAISETIVLLGEYARHGDWNWVRTAALQDNLLQKGSSETVIGILKAVKRRVFLRCISLLGQNVR